MTRIPAILAVLACTGLAGCTPSPAGQSPAAATGAPGQAALAIDGLELLSRNITATAKFAVRFKVKDAGSGTITQYGLATELATKRYPVGTPLPVIRDGVVLLKEVGPLPDQTRSGKFALQFWVIDDRGNESNRLSAEIGVQ